MNDQALILWRLSVHVQSELIENNFGNVSQHLRERHRVNGMLLAQIVADKFQRNKTRLILRKLFPDLISNFRQRPFTHAKSRLIGNLDLPQ